MQLGRTPAPRVSLEESNGSQLTNRAASIREIPESSGSVQKVRRGGARLREATLTERQALDERYAFRIWKGWLWEGEREEG
jgi:hypothetical protein